MVDPDHPHGTRPELEFAILRALAVEERLDTLALSRIVDADPAVVDQVCYHLHCQDAVRLATRADYAITDTGRRHLQDHHRPTRPPTASQF
ncbi:MAG: hypothetical protein ABEJ57_06630 [Halobacteriaceae archaeon]